MTKVPRRILEKIRKLIAHRESAERIGSVEEAAAFAEKIARLLEEYNLEIADIPQSDGLDDIDPAVVTIGRGQWELILLGGVAAGHFCQVVRIRRKGSAVLVGTRANVAVAKAMFAYLCGHCEASWEELSDAMRADGYFRVRGAANSAGASYRKAFSIAVCNRYYEILQAREGAGSTALVRVGDHLQRRNNDWIDRRLVTEQIRMDVSVSDAFAAAMGSEAGDAVRIDGGSVESTGKPQREIAR